MGQDTKIEWAHHTFNPWIGCSKVSAGCKHCYAETLMDKRHGRVKWGPEGTRVRTSDANWKLPLRWNKQAEKLGIRYRVFCSSLADVFEDGKPELIQWRTDLFKLIDATPHLDWLLLTKRPENIERMWREIGDRGWLDDPRPNVWLGTSVENQEAANERIPHLLKAAHLCKHTFLSCEPLLGPVDLRPWLHIATDLDGLRRGFTDLHWVIAGGESGPKARPMHPDWARSLRDQCQAAGVPFFFKQFGEWLPLNQDQNEVVSYARHKHHQFEDGSYCYAVGKGKAGRLLDGVEHNDVPHGD